MLDLRSAEAKFRRANLHIDSLMNIIEATRREVGQIVRLDAELTDATTRTYRFVMGYVPDLEAIAEQVSATAGDALTNLRACLDHITWQLAIRHQDPPSNPRAVQFPICRFGVPTADDPPKAHQAAAFLSAAHREFLHAFQPCQEPVGGTPPEGPRSRGVSEGVSWQNEFVHPLLVLQRLNNADKHQSLTQVEVQPNGFSMPWAPRLGPPIAQLEHSSRWDYSGRSGVVATGEEFMRCRVVDWTEPAYHGVGQINPDFVIAGDGRGLAFEVSRVSQFVERLLDAARQEL